MMKWYDEAELLLPPQRELFFTFFLHSSTEAFVKSTEAALIPLVFVNDTLATEPVQASGKSA